MKNAFVTDPVTYLWLFYVAQQKPATKPATATLPKLTVSLGGIRAEILRLTQLKEIVDSPLVVKDEKGISYAIKSFRINYTFKSSYKDEETQEVKVGERFPGL